MSEQLSGDQRHLMPPLAGHDLRVTAGSAFGRAHVDCDCSTPPAMVHPSKRAANRVAVAHYEANGGHVPQAVRDALQ